MTAIVGGMTVLLPYGTGICHYAFGYFSVVLKIVFVHSVLFLFSFFSLRFLFFFNLHFLALDLLS